jgi:hypothetical protein
MSRRLPQTPLQHLQYYTLETILKILRLGREEVELKAHLSLPSLNNFSRDGTETL